MLYCMKRVVLDFFLCTEHTVVNALLILLIFMCHVSIYVSIYLEKTCIFQTIFSL